MQQDLNKEFLELFHKLDAEALASWLKNLKTIDKNYIFLNIEPDFWLPLTAQHAKYREVKKVLLDMAIECKNLAIFSLALKDFNEVEKLEIIKGYAQKEIMLPFFFACKNFSLSNILQVVSFYSPEKQDIIIQVFNKSPSWNFTPLWLERYLKELPLESEKKEFLAACYFDSNDKIMRQCSKPYIKFFLSYKSYTPVKVLFQNITKRKEILEYILHEVEDCSDGIFKIFAIQFLNFICTTYSTDEELDKNLLKFVGILTKNGDDTLDDYLTFDYIISLKNDKKAIIALLRFATIIQDYKLFHDICFITGIYNNLNVITIRGYIISNSIFSIKYLCDTNRDENLVIKALSYLQNEPQLQIINSARKKEFHERYNDLLEEFPTFLDIQSFHNFISNKNLVETSNMLQKYGLNLLINSNYKGLKIALQTDVYAIVKSIVLFTRKQGIPIINQQVDNILIDYSYKYQTPHVFDLIISHLHEHQLSEIMQSSPIHKLKIHIALYLKQYSKVEMWAREEDINLTLREKMLFIACRLNLTLYIAQIEEQYNYSDQEIINVLNSLIADNIIGYFIFSLSTKMKCLQDKEKIWEKVVKQRCIMVNLFQYAINSNNNETMHWIIKNVDAKYISEAIPLCIKDCLQNNRIKDMHILFQYRCLAEKMLILPYLTRHNIATSIPLKMKLVLKYSNNIEKESKEVMQQLPYDCSIATYEQTMKDLSFEQFLNSINFARLFEYRPEIIIRAFAAFVLPNTLQEYCIGLDKKFLSKNHSFFFSETAMFLQQNASQLINGSKHYTMTQLKEIKEAMGYYIQLNNLICVTPLLTSLETNIPWNIIFMNGFSTPQINMTAIQLVKHKEKGNFPKNVIGSDKISKSWCTFLELMNSYHECRSVV